MSKNSFPGDLLPAAEKIRKNYPEARAALLPILHLFQNRDGYIKEGVDQIIADYLSLPVIKVREVLSFYTLYAKQPQGKRHFQFCRTLTCSLLGGEALADYFGKKVGIKPGEVSKDGQFSYELVECLGACEIAPMVRAGKCYAGPLNEPKIDKLIQEKPHA